MFKASKTHKIFVYGTLLDKSAQRVQGTLQGRMFDCAAGAYPGIIIQGQRGRNSVNFSKAYEIHGEIIENVPYEMLKDRYDSYEGYYQNNLEQSLYIRQTIQVQNHSCWVYLFNGVVDNLPEITSGNWEKYKKSLIYENLVT